MATVIKIANYIVKYSEREEVADYLRSLGDDWQQFIENELRRSNETNSKSLGGPQPRSSMDEEDNEKDYEMNMEKIMQKFSNFNSVLNQKDSNNDEDEDEDDNNNDKKNNEEEFSRDY